MREERGRERSWSLGLDRGQSEVIGFTAIFTLVVLLVAVLSTAGYTQLRDVRTSERANAAEAAIERFASEVDGLLRGASDQRDVAVGLGGGSISAGESITVTVSGDGFSETATLRSISFRTAGTRIVYVAGAVIRVEDSDAAVMVREPPGYLSESRTVLPLVDANYQGNQIGGRSTVILSASRPADGSRLLQYSTTTTDVTIEIESPWPDVWMQYLSDELGDGSCSTSGETVTCTYTTDHLSLVGIQVNVSVEQ